MANEPRTVVKSGANYKVYSDGSMLVTGVIASYPHLGEGQVSEFKRKDGTTKSRRQWSVDGLLPKATHEEAKSEIMRQIKLVIEKGKSPKAKYPKKFLKDGDRKDDDGEPIFKEMQWGHYILTARENKRPKVRGRAKGSFLSPDEADEKIEGGVHIDILFRPWVFVSTDPEVPNSVGANLWGVRFVKDTGLRFGESSRLSDDEVDNSFDDDGDDPSDGEDDDNDDL